MKDGTAAGPNGWGLDHALDAWGAYETIAVNNRKFASWCFKDSN
jgi:hypothetical protein